MRNSIEHLDFYPVGAETIAALQDMHAMDSPPQEDEPQSVSLQREKTYAAILETSVAVCGASVGYLGYQQATRHNQSGSSERLPEITLGIVAGFAVAAALAAGITRAWGAKTWERIKAATSRD